MQIDNNKKAAKVFSCLGIINTKKNNLDKAKQYFDKANLIYAKN